MNTNERKAQQLGMPAGTAAGRLRKILMYDLLVRLNEHYCFRCGLSIDSSSELTIEHKEPWFNQNPELFWDLENIAFSHARCNRPHTYTVYKPRPKRATHGQPQMYRDGCRCIECKDWKKRDNKRWRQ